MKQFLFLSITMISACVHGQGFSSLDFVVGSPVYVGRIRPYQLLLDTYATDFGLNPAGAARFSVVNPGIMAGLVMGVQEDQWKLSISWQRTRHRTSWGDRHQQGAAAAQYRIQYNYLCFDVARRINTFQMGSLSSHLYLMGGLHFGTGSSAWRVGRSAAWTKDAPGIAVAYDKTGLAALNLAVLAEVAVNNIIVFYPKVGYQLAFSGEKGPPGLVQYIGYNGARKAEAINQRASRLYIEFAVGVRLGDPLFNTLGLKRK